jgi:hypothetical protein
MPKEANDKVTEANPIDPTKNVRELVELTVKRIDDLATVREKNTENTFRDRKDYYDLKINDTANMAAQRFEAQDKAINAALDGTKEAINKADVNTDKRFSLLSEKIDGITNTMNKSTGERGIYVTHSDLSVEMEKLRNSFEIMLRPVVTFMNSQTGKEDESKNIWAYIIALAGIALAIVALILKI